MPGADAPVSFDLWRVSLPLLRPVTAAHGTETERDVVLVAARLADGTVGWGECSALARPTYTGEWTEGAWAVLRTELLPAALAGRPSGVVGHPMAGAAVATAVLDARLRTVGRSMAAELGGTPGRSIPCTAVSGLLTPDELVDAVAGDVADGYRSVKCKIAPGQDLEPLAAVRATWPDLRLAADANGAYREGDLDRLRRLDRLGLAYVEQPLPADDLLGSARVAARLDTPVALDESITSRRTAEVAVALGAGTVLSVKPARLGGVAEAMEAIAWAAAAGVDVFVGGMLETGVGRAAALAVASIPALAMPTDLGPSRRYFERDLTAPFELTGDATLTVPDGAGLGVVPDADRLAACAREHIQLRG